MKKYIIDGNNVIGKSSTLKKIQKKDKQVSREKLVWLIESYFVKKNVKISLYFDGFPKEELRISRGKVKYSGKLTADELIKKEIEKSKNPKNIAVVSSDLNLVEFSRKCRCTTVSSIEFINQINSNESTEEEIRRIQELNNPDEFKKLFGVE